VWHPNSGKIQESSSIQLPVQKAEEERFDEGVGDCWRLNSYLSKRARKRGYFKGVEPQCSLKKKRDLGRGGGKKDYVTKQRGVALSGLRKHCVWKSSI